VSPRRKVVHDALAVAVLFVGPEPPGCDAADDRVQVIPPGGNVVLQQAPALQITDGVCQFLCGGEDDLFVSFRRLMADRYSCCACVLSASDIPPFVGFVPLPPAWAEGGD